MKLLKIIFINIILFGIGLFFCDYLIYKQVCNEYRSRFTPDKTDNFPPPKYKYFYTHEYSYTSVQFLKNNKNLSFFRKTPRDNLTEPMKEPILLFGCSFAYGGLLKDKQTFAYKLQQKTNRPVYNYAISAGGLQHMLYIIQNPEFFDEVKGNPEYAVYLYIADHQRRLVSDSHPIETNGLFLKYKLKNGKLEMQKEIFPSFFYRTFLVREFLYKSYRNYFDNEFLKESLYNNMLLTNNIFLESRRLLKEKYPNIKFVILKYSDNQPVFEHEDMWKMLKNEGFIVIDTKDLVGRKFTVEDTAYDNFHPNEQAWEMIVPLLVKDLNM